MARGEQATAGAARGQGPHVRGSRGLRRLWGFLALALVVPAMAVLSIAPAQAGGNSGTIKIHAEGSPSGTESNEPHVCGFNIEAFGFDEGFDGYITFEVQGGDGPTGVAAGPFAVGPANAAGYFATNYFNVANGPVIKDGHYKVTLFGKFNGRINYEDVKAKSKVFKVDCPAPPPPPRPPRRLRLLPRRRTCASRRRVRRTTASRSRLTRTSPTRWTARLSRLVRSSPPVPLTQ